MYYNNSGKHNICVDELNRQYLMELKWYHTIENFFSADMLSIMSLIGNHTDLNSDTVKCMCPLAFSDKKLRW